jgi:hypothetical protein
MASNTVLILGISKLAAWAGTDNDVTSSSRRLSAVQQEVDMGKEVDADDGM